MQLIEPIIAAKHIDNKVHTAEFLDTLYWLIAIGYNAHEMVNEEKFEAAKADLINQIKYN